MNQVIETLDRDPSSVDLSTDNPVQLAALLKRFLRDLPDPLMTYKLHKLWIMTQSTFFTKIVFLACSIICLAIPDPTERARLVRMVTLLLPRYHRDTLEVLLVFLKWVASFAHVDEETGSKMDLGNLATVITPSILKANRRDGARDESFPGIRVVTELLEEQDELLLAPEEFLPILQNQNYFTATLDQPRELLKKIDTFLRLRHGSSGQFAPSAYPPRGSAPSPAFYTPSPSSSRSNQDLYTPPPGPNGIHPVDRSGAMTPSAEYSGKSLPLHPGIQHQTFSSPHPTSRLQDPASTRPSLDNFWALPLIPTSDSQQESPNLRPSSYLKPSDDSSSVFGAASPSRNSPLGA